MKTSLTTTFKIVTPSTTILFSPYPLFIALCSTCYCLTITCLLFTFCPPPHHQVNFIRMWTFWFYFVLMPKLKQILSLSEGIEHPPETACALRSGASFRFQVWQVTKVLLWELHGGWRVAFSQRFPLLPVFQGPQLDGSSCGKAWSKGAFQISVNEEM